MPLALEELLERLLCMQAGHGFDRGIANELLLDELQPLGTFVEGRP